MRAKTNGPISSVAVDARASQSSLEKRASPRAISASVSKPDMALAVSKSASSNGRHACGRAKLHRLFEAFDPQLPKHIAVAIIDGEVRRIGPGPLEKPFREIIVVRHDEREHFVQVIHRVEGGRRLLVRLAPDDRQPFARRDHLRTNEHAGDEPIEFFQHHGLLAHVEEGVFKLPKMARRLPHEASISKEGDHRSG